MDHWSLHLVIKSLGLLDSTVHGVVKSCYYGKDDDTGYCEPGIPDASDANRENAEQQILTNTLHMEWNLGVHYKVKIL